MFLEYFHWHYIVAPRWLNQFFWHLELALLHFFSVGFMLKTLFSHWHRDVTAYRGSLQDLAIIFAWNQISRLIGFLIRSSVLILWACVQVIYITLAVAFFVAFIIWPLLVLASLVAGFVLVFLNPL